MLMDKLVTVGIKHIQFWQHAGIDPCTCCGVRKDPVLLIWKSENDRKFLKTVLMSLIPRFVAAGFAKDAN